MSKQHSNSPIGPTIVFLVLIFSFFSLTSFFNCPTPEDMAKHPPDATIQELGEHPQEFYHTYIRINEASISNTRYAFGRSLFTISDDQSKHQFIVLSKFIRTKGQTLKLYCFVKPLYCNNEGCFILLKEVCP